MNLTIPETSLVILLGASGSGKSSFARKHFAETEILSSDFFRGMVSDSESNQAASKDAFDVLHYVLEKRLAAGRLTVVDATNLQHKARRPLLKLAKQYHFYGVAIALNLPEAICQQQNQQRPGRQVPRDVISNQVRKLNNAIPALAQEKTRYVYTLSTLEEIAAAEIDRQPLKNNKKKEHGPFDIIGDIHGCCDELEELLQQMGYEATNVPQENAFWQFPTYRHPEGRKAIFLGDLVDRGPRILDTVRLSRNMVQAGNALCILGNHENKFMRWLSGKKVKLTYGLAETVAEVEAMGDERKESAINELQSFFNSLISHYVLDWGRLVVAHAGLKKEMQGRRSGATHNFAMYGEATGETDEFGLPVRYEWAQDYKGKAAVVYGHTPVAEAKWLNNTIDIDTGCVFGGKLTSLRYPEKELVSVAATKMYCRPVKPLSTSWSKGAASKQSEVIEIDSFLGKRVLSTRLYRKITLKEAGTAAALEVLSRFGVDPKWLIYLPPTIAPVESSKLPGFLEHPTEAFDYYQAQGAGTVMCQEKHMGTRAVVIVCRDAATVQKRFGIKSDSIGICYTSTGRRFFDDLIMESAFLGRIQKALSETDFWTTLSTDWVCLDCELLPWSAKAQGLLKHQYAAVGSAATHGLKAAMNSLDATSARGVNVGELRDAFQKKDDCTEQYTNTYRRYCWPVESLTDLKLAPFHIMATEGQVHIDKTHEWHMQQINRIVQVDTELLQPTQYTTVEVNDEKNRDEGIRWWEELTYSGGEGMVVKPVDFVHRGHKGFAQPALKCRGVEALRLVYGPEYLEGLEKLRKRGVGGKRSTALREFSLGIESLERFAAKETLSRIRECVSGVLALESEPIDSRL